VSSAGSRAGSPAGSSAKDAPPSAEVAVVARAAGGRLLRLNATPDLDLIFLLASLTVYFG